MSTSAADPQSDAPDGARHDPSDEAVDEYLDHLAVERGLAANTVAAYRRDLRRYQQFCRTRGVSDPAQVTPATVTDYAAALRAGQFGPRLSDASVGRAIVAVRGFHAFLAAEGAVAGDPAREVSPPRPGFRLPKGLPVDDVLRLLEAPDPHVPAGLRDRAILELLYGTGCRVSELTGADIDDLDLDQRTFTVLGKGNKQRIVPVGRHATTAVEAYLVRARPTWAAKGPSTPALILNPRGGRLSRQSVWAVIARAAETAGLSGVHPHTLRHSYATHLLQGGADVRVVQELLGHASVTTTQIYTMVTIDHLREVYATSHPRGR